MNDGRRWDLVFNIAEGLHGLGREAQVPALLDAFEIPYTFSDPLVLSLTMHKGLTKRVVARFGHRDPRLCRRRVVSGRRECNATIPALRETGRRRFEQRHYRRLVGSQLGPTGLRSCGELLEQYRQPVLVETYLPGRELTVGIVGTGANARVLGAMEVLLEHDSDRDVYSYANKVDYESRVRYRLVEGSLGLEAGNVALAVWRGLGCRDAGRVDLRCDAAGRVHFLEVNPLAGLNPQHSDLPILCSLAGVPYRELIRMILDSACQRLQVPLPGTPGRG